MIRIIPTVSLRQRVINLYNNRSVRLYGVMACMMLLIAASFFLVRSRIELRQLADLANFIAPDLSPFAWTIYENRFDLDGDGSFDSYWSGGINTDNKTCTITLFDIKTKAKRWDSTIPNCTGLPNLPIFHTKSFIGNSTRDFTITIKGINFATNDKDYHILAGDGDNGQLRGFDLFMGNAESASTVRLKGVQVVDLQLPSYPGPALFVRTTSDGFRGHLYYFPQNSSTFTEITSLWGNPPFPGVDLPDHGYSTAYNAFNYDLVKCSPISDATSDPTQCGIPDNGKGQGLFLDQAAVADIDNDGVEDILTTYFWKYVVYPGKPKGSSQYVGAAQFEAQYNPQNDGSACHSGRHYGVNEFVSVEGDPFLEQVDIGGTTVNNFNDIYQNVSRNIAVIKTSYHPTLPTYERSLTWNVPMGTSIPSCGANNTNGNSKLYDNSIHYQGTGIIRDIGGKAKYIDYNRFTQTSTNSPCAHTDINCHNQILASMSGNWTWELRNISNGTIAKAFSNMYVWDTIPNNTSSFWVVYSSLANTWNLGDKDLNGNSKFRNDITIALFDTTTLSLSNQQIFTSDYFPFLKISAPQNITPSFASIWLSNKIFIITVENNSLPGFVLKSPTGLELAVYNGSTWIVAAKYTTSGKLISSTTTPTTIPSATPTTIQSICPSNGLSYLWNFNNSANPFASQNGTATGTPKDITLAEGKIEKGIGLNGTSSYIDFGNINNFERTQPFTISAWVNQALGSASKFIIARQDNMVNGAGYKLATDGDGSPIFSFGPDQNLAIQVNASQDIRGNWHLITVTYDGSSMGKGLKIYVDGLFKASGNGPNLTSSTKTSETFRLGARENASFALFQGTLDEIGIWTRPLSSDEVLSLYNQGNGIACTLHSSGTPTSIPSPTPTVTNIPTPKITLSPTPTKIPTPTPTESRKSKKVRR